MWSKVEDSPGKRCSPHSCHYIHKVIGTDVIASPALGQLACRRPDGTSAEQEKVWPSSSVNNVRYTPNHSTWNPLFHPLRH